MKFKLISPLIMWLLILLGISVIVNITPSFRLIPRNMFTPFIFLPSFLIWLYFFIGSVRVNRRIYVSSQKTRSIVKNGVYTLCRHPVYFGDIVLFYGLFFIYPTLKLGLSVVWLNCVLVYWSKAEEEILIKKFGNIYRVYQIKTPRLIPRLKSKN